MVPVPIGKRRPPESEIYLQSRMRVYYAYTAVCGSMVLDQQQQYHQDLLDVKCSGPPRPAQLDLYWWWWWGTGVAHICVRRSLLGVLVDLDQ